MEEQANTAKIKVAITGTLSQPRKVFVDRINASQNGVFVDYITFETHYLVSTKHDSNKARKAARIGTAVISESELNEILATGVFPSTLLPTRPATFTAPLPHVEWTRIEPEHCLLTYRDASDNVSVRRILWVSNGARKGSEGMLWLGGFDGPVFKTWKASGIESLEILPETWEKS